MPNGTLPAEYTAEELYSRLLSGEDDLLTSFATLATHVRQLAVQVGEIEALLLEVAEDMDPGQ